MHLALHAIGQESDPVRAIACEGVAKLLLSGKLYDDLVGVACWTCESRREY